MRINTNVASLNAQGAASQVGKNLNSSLEKLSTGLRINKAADDASGMAIADKLKIQASSLGQSISNAGSASALIQIADKAMGEQSNILDIVKTKLIQAKDATTSQDGRQAILNDIQKLLTQLDNIASQTNYNGTTLLQSSSTSPTASSALSFQVGESSTNTISSTAASSNTANLGGGSTVLSTTSAAATLAASSTTAIQATGAADMIEFKGDAEAAATGHLNITLSGIVGELSGGVAVTFTSTNADDLAFLAEVAINAADLTKSGNNYTLSAANDIDFGTHEFSGLTATTSTAATTGASQMSMYTSSAVTVKNNGSSEIEANAQTGGLTGGELLSTLKALGSGSLTATKSGDFMSVVDAAVTKLNSTRSDFGSTQNQLESAIRNMSTTQVNIKAAESSIRDVDYAAESANFNKQNIIAQAGTYAMSQANAIQQNVLRLLQ